MNITTILIIINVFAALTMIVLTLMQQSKGDMGSAFGGGGSQSMFGSRGSANFLSRATSIMCIVFFVSSLTLAYVYSNRNASDSVVGSDSVIQETSEIPSLDDTSVPSIDDSSVPNLEDPVEADTSVPEVLESTSQEIIDAIEAETAPEVPSVPE